MNHSTVSNGLRCIPPQMDAAIVAAIDERLNTVERDHGVKILLAIESGSRAWGFPSPDSDYDCRFIYIRAARDYTTLFPKRDVIETPLTEIFDVNGWDLAKALKLLLAGNAVVIEWLMSPIAYGGNAQFRDSFLKLAETCADRVRIAQHYLHLGQSIYTQRLGDLDDIPLKKLFYALRPAMALRWMRLNPHCRLPPMNFQQLCHDARVPAPLAAIIEDLLARKSVTRELGRGAMPQVIRDAILLEFQLADAAFSQTPGERGQCEAQADDFFRTCIANWAST